MTRRRAATLALVLLLLPSAVIASEGGLSIFPEPTQLVILIVLFVALIGPANRLLFAPLMGVLDERGRLIDGAREEAREVGRQADEVLGQYETAVGAARRAAEADRREILDEARREHSRLMAEARAEAESEVARGRGEVDQAVERARRELRGQAEELAQVAASRVLGRELS